MHTLSWQVTQHRWENNIKMDLTEIGWDGMDWINLAHDMYKCWCLVNT